MTNDPNWQGFTNLLPEDVETLLAIAQANDWLRAALHTLARRGTALRQQAPDRAFELLQLLSPHPFYKAGQFLFDLLEWEDFIVDGPPPDSIDTIMNTESVRAVSAVLRGLKGYLDGALPRDMNVITSLDPMSFVTTGEDLPPLEPGFYLYQDIVLGLLNTVIQRRPLCLTVDPAQIDEDSLLVLPCDANGFELSAPDHTHLTCILDAAANNVVLLLPDDELRVSLPGGAQLIIVSVRHRQQGTLLIRMFDRDARLLAERVLQPEEQLQEIVIDMPAAYLTLSGGVAVELHGLCVYRFLGSSAGSQTHAG